MSKDEKMGKIKFYLFFCKKVLQKEKKYGILKSLNRGAIDDILLMPGKRLIFISITNRNEI